MALRDTPRTSVCVCVCCPVWLFVTPWTVAHHAPLSMEISWQEYWSGLPFPPRGDLPDPGIKSTSLVPPALAGRFFTLRFLGSPQRVWSNSYLPINMKVPQYLNNSCVIFFNITGITDIFILPWLLNNVLFGYRFIFSQHFEYNTPWSSGFYCCFEKSFEGHYSYKCNMFLLWHPFLISLWCRYFSVFICYV